MLRIHLTGRVTLESPDLVIRDTQFPGPQALLAFVWLVFERRRPVAIRQLAEALWGDEPPVARDAAIAALLSKLRRAMRPVATPPPEVARRFGSVQLELPSATWVDVEAALGAADEAEGHWRRRDLAAAWAAANVAVSIGREPLLPDMCGTWLQARRTLLHGAYVRGLTCLADASLANGEASLAVAYARQRVAAEPLRESGYRQLMRTYATLGDRGEALGVYHDCRRLLRDELGTAPSADTEALFLQLLKG